MNGILLSDTNKNQRSSVNAMQPSMGGTFKKCFIFYLFLLPAVLQQFVLAYIPLGGVVVAFQDFSIFKGIFNSPWVGLKHIQAIFQIPEISQSILNTLTLSLMSLAFSFPAPLILAILLNELRNGIFKKTVQTISYMPYFLSWISVIGLCIQFFSTYGPLNDLRLILLGEETQRILFMSQQKYFVPLVIGLSIWKNTGWNSILYLAAMTSIDPQLYEAASIDGAGRFKQMITITLPGIAPTAVILLILQMGGMFSSNFELVYGMQNPYINYEVIDTLVYKSGIKAGNYSMATAIGLTRGLVALALTIGANQISKRINQQSIF